MLNLSIISFLTDNEQRDVVHLTYDKKRTVISLTWTLGNLLFIKTDSLHFKGIADLEYQLNL